MFKDEYKKKFDEVAPDPVFRLRLEERIEDMQNKKNRGVMRRAAIIAVAAMLALTTVGFATGAFRSIFSGMMDAFENGPTMDYEHMEAAADTNVDAQTVTFGSGVTAEVRLEQSYYNGQQLAMGWSVTDDAKAEFLDRDDERVANAEEGVLAVDLEEKLGEENAAEFLKRFETEGWAGAAWYECYLSDGTYLANVEKVVGDDGMEHVPGEGLFIPEMDHDWHEDGVLLSYDEFETPLPEAAQDKDGLRVARKISCQMCWLIVDGDKVYTGREPAESVELAFEIARSEDYVETVYRADAQFANYTAKIELNSTPIKAHFSVNNQVGDEWKAVWEGYEGYLKAPMNLAEDVVFDYEIYVDGKKIAFDTSSYRGVDGMEGWFLLPSNAKSVTFRPVYANTGANADEDIVIGLE